MMMVGGVIDSNNDKPVLHCKSLQSPLIDNGSDHFGHLGISFLTSFNQQLFRNIAYVWYSWHFNKAVFVYLYLYLCICVFDSWEYQF